MCAQSRKDAGRAYAALRAAPGVICAQVNSSTGVVRTRGVAALRDLVAVLEGIGLEAKAAPDAAEPTEEPAGKRPPAGEDIGYIADTR